MYSSLERVIGDAIVGARKAIVMSDDFETMLEMWVSYMTGRAGGVTGFINQLNQYDDNTFNTDGYHPTILAVPLNLIAGMSSIGVDLIKGSTVPVQFMYLTDCTSLPVVDQWLIFTVVEQGHPLKGLRYVSGFKDGELCTVLTEPDFTFTYSDEEVILGGRGTFIDKRERFLRAVRPELFNDQ